MTVRKEFILTVEALDEDACVLVPGFIESTVRNSFQSTVVTLLDVRRYVPGNDEWTGKLAAIKKIRTYLDENRSALVSTSLRDAKFLADAAQDKGRVRWGDMLIQCRPAGISAYDEFNVAIDVAG
jgi:hypothetical protein